MNSKFSMTRLTTEPRIITSLADLLIETVANGGSVSFMHPLSVEMATAFWESSLAAADCGKRVILGMFNESLLIGTVTLLLDCPPNQPHRAEIAKLMTRTSHRRQGVARALMQEAERLAIDCNRTLLTLDTAEEDGAAGLYEELGFQKAGVIPNFALKPRGGLTGTIIYWKRIGEDGFLTL